MTRAARPGGLVCVAVPNHHALPCRLAYLTRRLLGRLSYPPEKKIRSLRGEFALAGLHGVERQAVADDMRFSHLPINQLTALPFRIAERATGRTFAGYLEVVWGRKVAEPTEPNPRPLHPASTCSASQEN